MLLLEHKPSIDPPPLSENNAPETPTLKIVHPSNESNDELNNVEIKEVGKPILGFKPFLKKSKKHQHEEKLSPQRGWTTGDFVTARVEGYPFLFHRGIIVVEEDGEVFIYHNTPMLKNQVGGNIVREKIEDWVHTRDIMSVESTDMTKEYIQEESARHAHKKFDTVSWNCEAFAFTLKDGVAKNPQVFWWGVGIAVTAFTVYKIVTLIKNRKK